MRYSVHVFAVVVGAALFAGLGMSGCAHHCCSHPELVYYQGGVGIPPKHDVAFVDPPVDIPTVHFALDSDKLDATAQSQIGLIANELREHPHARVAVHGHTCDLASDDYNMKLGADRASAVRDYLLAQGVQPRQIEIATHGESDPAAPNQPGTRPLNRRAEFAIDIDDRY
ncbi:MAG: OmpA family protein [Candidatus Hydrogenedentes bacterium]|nr:OmpA family protein [Candidatus Hydrogenedentota bacterium]